MSYDTVAGCLTFSPTILGSLRKKAVVTTGCIGLPLVPSANPWHSGWANCMWSCSHSTFRSATTGLRFAVTHHCLCQLHKVWLLVGVRCRARNWENLCERYWYVIIVILGYSYSVFSSQYWSFFMIYLPSIYCIKILDSRDTDTANGYCLEI